MSRKIKARFENGIFWEVYNDLERQFQNFLEYIPYLPGNEDVHSFRLLNLILSIGGYVDSAFKEMARYKAFRNNVDCQKILTQIKGSERRVKMGRGPKTISVKLELSAFEALYKLSGKKVIFKCLPEREILIPFKPHNPKTNAPDCGNATMD